MAPRKKSAPEEKPEAIKTETKEPTTKAAKSAPAKGVAGVQGKQAEFKTTVAHMLGEIIWLLNQSPIHRHFSISDLDWIVAPAVGLGQYRVFRTGDKPIGVAFWAFVNTETDDKLQKGAGRIRPDEWKNGENLWLIDLVAPFANAENKMTEAMFVDLVNGPFNGKKFRFTKTNPQTGKREVAEFTPNE